MKRFLRSSLALFYLLPFCAGAQAPELSADAPIAYSEATGLLIASGNAVYEDENTRVEADEIEYDRERNRIEATGNVRVTRKGLRLLADYLTYDAGARTFSASNFRAGYPPLFIEGDSFSGSLDAVDFSKVTLYIREPVASSPRLSMESGQWVADEYIRGRGLSLQAFGNLGLPLPGITYAFGQPSLEVEARLGWLGNLGAYGQSHILYPFNAEWSAGGNLDFYTKRGILLGPSIRWIDRDSRDWMRLNTGWIHDHSFEERASDLLGVPIQQDRGFVDFAATRSDETGSLQVQLKGTYLSDSEVFRDFREDRYVEAFQPDSYADFTWQAGSFLFNAFARTQVNDYYTLVERLPELRAEWLPEELGQTGIYLQAAAAATRYREQRVVPTLLSVTFPDNPLGLPSPPLDPGLLPGDLIDSRFFNRLDGVVTLTRPFHGPLGTRMVLRGGGRWTQYHQESGAGAGPQSDDRWVGELGVDLSQTLGRTYSADWPTWDIETIHHRVRTLVQYRWHPGAEETLSVLPAFDTFPYRAGKPVLDLADLRHLDSLREWNIARLGWEHALLVAGESGAYRDFLSLNFYQDLLLERDPEEDLLDGFYTEMAFDPLPWFHMVLAQKFRFEEGENEATYVRAEVSSADLWTLGMQAEYLQEAIHQYQADLVYRLSENFGLLGSWHYDSRLSAWTRQRYGVVRRFGNVWQLDFYVTLNDENNREDEISTGFRLRWISF